MSFGSSPSLYCWALLLGGALALTAGCSSSPDKEAGSSGSGSSATLAKPPVAGDGASTATNPPELTFSGEGKLTEPVVEPTIEPPIASPGVPSTGNSGAESPITVPPDLPSPPPSTPAKPAGSASPRAPGEPELVVPKKSE